MNILLDAMGGDNAPDANIKGALKAINQIQADITLIGKEEVIRQKIKEFTGKEMDSQFKSYKMKTILFMLIVTLLLQAKENICNTSKYYLTDRNVTRKTKLYSAGILA